MMPDMAASDRGWIDSWLSPSRFDVYANLCSGSLDNAFVLYEMEHRLGQIPPWDLAHFEIDMRNAYDAAITNHWNGTGHWLFGDWRTFKQDRLKNATAKTR